MKKLAILLLIASFGFAGCKKDKLPPPQNEFTIIGKWILTDSKRDFHNSGDQIIDVETSNPKIVFEFDNATCKVNGIVTPYTIETPFARTFIKFPDNLNIAGIGNRMELIPLANPSTMLWANERNDLSYSDENGVDRVAPKTLVYSSFYKP